MSLKKNAWIAIAALFVLLIIWVISSKNERVTVLEEHEEVPEIVEPRVVLTLPADTLRFEKHTIASGESFGALLGKRGIGTAQIYKIAAAVEDDFNVRRIRAGVEVQFATGDSALFPTYFIYPESKYEYWIIGLQDSIYAKKVEKEREVRRRAISGTIDDALYLSVGRSGGTQALAMSLVEVYAWTIDFFRLQKGDAFSVIYEEEFMCADVATQLKTIIGNFHASDKICKIFYNRC